MIRLKGKFLRAILVYFRRQILMPAAICRSIIGDNIRAGFDDYQDMTLPGE